MVDRTRLSLAVPTVPRNAQNQDKDALIQNCYIDTSKNGVSMAVKRPGFIVGSEAITTGNNRGIYVNPQSPASGANTVTWYINGSGVLTSQSINPFAPPPEEVDFEFTLNILQLPEEEARKSLTVSKTSATSDYMGVQIQVFDQDFFGLLLYQSSAPTAASFGFSWVVGSYNIKVRLESDYYKVYIDDVFLGQLLKGSSTFISPVLEGLSSDTDFLTFENLQFL